MILKRHPEQHLSFDMSVILQKTPIELTSKLTKVWDFDTTTKQGSVTGLQCLADLLLMRRHYGCTVSEVILI